MWNYLIPVIPFHKQILVKGERSYVYDINGKRYLDLNSGQFCAVLGHSHPELSNEIAKASNNLVHTSSGMLSKDVLEVAEMIHNISGEMRAYSIFLSTGAEAIEFAIRYAKHITERDGIICLDKGYHGLTLGAQSVTFGGVYTKPHVSSTYKIPIPDTFCNQGDIDDCIKELERVVDLNSGTVAAVIMEPIVSVGGMIFPPKSYFQRVANICEKNGIILIFDECQTGFGRTGKWFYYQKLGIIPDIVVCAKGVGMGYPVSMVMFNEQLIKRCKITMTHYSSHQNDPFAATIIKFGINYIEKNNLLPKIERKGKVFLEKLRKLCCMNNMYVNPRGNGLMLGVDLKLIEIENYRPVYQKLSEAAADKGLLIQGTDGGRVLRFLPDYLIEEKDIEFCVDVLASIKDLS